MCEQCMEPEDLSLFDVMSEAYKIKYGHIKTYPAS